MSEVPNTFDEAVAFLHDQIGEDRELMDLSVTTDRLIVRLHDSLGRMIRNDWKLWADSPLKEDMERLGFIHADDMSSAILKRFLCEIRNETYDVEADAAAYQAYWNNMGCFH